MTSAHLFHPFGGCSLDYCIVFGSSVVFFQRLWNGKQVDKPAERNDDDGDYGVNGSQMRRGGLGLYASAMIRAQHDAAQQAHDSSLKRAHELEMAALRLTECRAV